MSSGFFNLATLNKHHHIYTVSFELDKEYLVIQFMMR